MGLLNIFKKKKRIPSLDLPPPPLPVSIEPDIPTIRVRPELELPKFPELPEESEEIEQVEEERRFEEPAVEKSVEPMETVQSTVSELFVSVDDYRSVMQNASAVRAKLMTSESTLKSLTDLHAEGERVLDKWARELSDVERKLSRVDAEIARAQL